MSTPQPARPVVLCVGMLTLDVVHVLQRLPGANEKVPELGQSLVFGGPAANAAATAAALGARVQLVAGFGRSAFTDLVASQLEAAGVDWHDPAAHVPSPSPLSTILLTDGTGERAVIGGAAPALPDDAALPDGLVEAANVVLLDGHAMPLAGQAARRARAAGVPVVFDGGSYKPGTEALLHDVDLAILSADFAAPDHSDPLRWVRRHGCRHAARSAGSEPLVLHEEAAPRTFAVPSGDVVDTLGAGDVLHGAAAYAVACGALRDLAAVLRFAVGLASLSCEYPGALGWARHSSGRQLAHRLATTLVHNRLAGAP